MARHEAVAVGVEDLLFLGKPGGLPCGARLRPLAASTAFLVFEPTARAIDGLEKALAGLGLLDQALATDLRRPQDYFSRLWNTGFPVPDLTSHADPDHGEDTDEERVEVA
ncbi:hypothetical protein ACIQF6_28085 [Kitasatospora sp. NPDC092948]|uniref:hypothetical protein n=1 Tax=Kitasatospora sp. NPDC092948 TaxID=3364088 RepID=UPI003824B402